MYYGVTLYVSSATEDGRKKKQSKLVSIAPVLALKPNNELQRKCDLANSYFVQGEWCKWDMKQ